MGESYPREKQRDPRKKKKKRRRRRDPLEMLSSRETTSSRQKLFLSLSQLSLSIYACMYVSQLSLSLYIYRNFELSLSNLSRRKNKIVARHNLQEMVIFI